MSHYVFLSSPQGSPDYCHHTRRDSLSYCRRTIMAIIAAFKDSWSGSRERQENDNERGIRMGITSFFSPFRSSWSALWAWKERWPYRTITRGFLSSLVSSVRSLPASLSSSRMILTSKHRTEREWSLRMSYGTRSKMNGMDYMMNHSHITYFKFTNTTLF